MNITSDFGKANTQIVPNRMQHYIFAFVQDSINHPDNLDVNKKWLKGYCEVENINYSELEFNLNLFFELLSDYSKSKTHILYSFIKLQAQYCFIDEERFHLLRIAPYLYEFAYEIQHASASSQENIILTSSGSSGIVGGHLLGL